MGSRWETEEAKEPGADPTAESTSLGTGATRGDPRLTGSPRWSLDELTWQKTGSTSQHGMDRRKGDFYDYF